MDNAATTWPKPETVYQAVDNCQRKKGGNPNRSGHHLSMLAGQVIFDTRKLVAKLFNIPNSSQVIFTPNATEAINLGIKGLLKTGDHVVTSSMEHNAVTRPLETAKKDGIEVTKIVTAPEMGLLPFQVEAAINRNTRMIILSHASNVTGTIHPILEIGQIAHERGILFMVDCAQTAGILPIDVQEMHIDILAFTGHKSMFGPQGTGGLYIKEGIFPRPLKDGGTGGNSASSFLPDELPDRYESGTLNTPGIAGLGAGIDFLLQTGMEAIRAKERLLIRQLLDGLYQIPGVIVYGPDRNTERAPVLSFNIADMEPTQVAFMLDKIYGIASRPGLQCAPDAHRTLETFLSGTVRLSLSYFNTRDEVDFCINSIAKIVASNQ